MLEQPQTLIARLHDASRNTYDCRAIRHAMHDHRSGPDLHIIAQADISQHGSPVSSPYATSDRRMPFGAIAARASQSHALIKQNVVPDLSGFTDHRAEPVIDEQALPDLRPRM